MKQEIAQVQARIAAACQRVGRSPEEVTLIAVSKTMPLEAVAVALEAGIVHLGENRLEEAIPKMQALSAAQWHMIGHIQSRKAKEVIGANFALVHSVDTLKLARRLDQFAGERGVIQPILLEVNVSGEASKSGWSAYDPAGRDQLWAEVAAIVELPHLRVEGLMTMAPYEAEPEATRTVFQALWHLREVLRQSFAASPWHHLSMGMTNDFEVAIEEGATLVRIGRAIFGERVTMG